MRWGFVLVACTLSAVCYRSNGFFGGGRRRQVAQKEIVEKDLYAVLGIDEEATAKEIKQAYRKLSLKYHPDRNQGKSAAAAQDQFREVSEAYDVLSSEEKKFLYDQGGLKLVAEAEADNGGGGEGMFGGFFGGHQQGNRGQDYHMRLRVTLEELYNGAEKEQKIMRRVVCPRCVQTKENKKKMTEAKKKRCDRCQRCPNELKMVQRRMGGFLVQQQEEVPSKEKCMNEEKLLTAVIERGMQEGVEIKFKYMSEQKPKQIPGNVIMVLHVSNHRLFERKGDHLHVTMKISLKESLTGFSRTIKHLDGHEVEINREDKVTYPFETVVLNGEGMPIHEVPSQFGDLHVTFDIQFPKKLNAEQIKELRDIL
uniref:J domain-containing protein n=1 Tax=Mucochytrium quahogii TaxID=96639 RepID=A0A7S2SEU7_9STRA|mmetsp:Transcript_7093/g.11264  ORF Transcript_7093/g.11264 Transcript_7093/m.11264 type:complete len:367 (-) Transcript_7093:463-1563(-)|eukprot:CAMPEP_0203749456 /NCGR_PEP_ID=MMETSP0098-20131031/4021_1 /ASSEMBLY_ACC=CAM_ASM_000208 /TAXON_ID=96639 /ORGANISM=" , Strain NY0313808BC1" /LENGTH=366 /DNA_ID=CAMNT_0050638527 /DNA_START=159 /DNA_END=1259 /DNA_ORIENTATION=-